MAKTAQENKTSESTIGAIARSVSSRLKLHPAVIQQAKLLLLDSIGCAFAACDDPVARAVVDVAIRDAGECAVIGRPQKTSVLGAVLANGTLVRVLDLNDYMIAEWKGEPETGGHPSDNIPVALSLGAARNRSGAEILQAIVAGYDVYARLQRLMDRGQGWDTVTVSGIAAPAIAGRLMGLDETRLAHALALGAARAATPGIVRGGDISAAKSIANALVAQ